jgi:tRNA pseudouridine32 synthase / 23S rRNA pseudouridine746 synthase
LREAPFVFVLGTRSVPNRRHTVPMLHAVHVDEDLLVLDKPAGLLAVPGRGLDKADSLYRRALAVWPGLFVVHRLDQATSGLMVFARHRAAAGAMGRAFAARQVHKEYLAVVNAAQHHPPLAPEDHGEIGLPLAPDWPRRPLQKVCHETGRPALTRWHVLALGAQGQVHMALQPLTGRSHQLRVHLAAMGWPIVGDTLYGGLPAPRLMLHAQTLALAHPRTGAACRWQQPAPF